MQKNIVIIPCSGIGKRMGLSLPKQFLELKGKPIICHTIEKFQQCNKIDEIVLVISKDYKDFFQDEILAKNDFSKVSNVVFGGDERLNSVYNGLCAISQQNSIILVHDAVRPLVKIQHIEKIIKETLLHKACVLGVKAKDTIKLVYNNSQIKTFNRDFIWLAQTPQAFDYHLIKRAYDEAIRTNFFGTDDASLVENIGHNIKMVLGDYENIKITTFEDLKIAELFL